MTSKVHVAVGVIKNADGKILISKRHKHLHQGDLWEFPGGKVEKNESAYEALCRELYEELNIKVTSAKQFIKISHHYSDKHVLLDVWLVDGFNGDAVSQHQQLTKWVSKQNLGRYPFPVANKAVLCCLSLSPYYAITGEYNTHDELLYKIKALLDSGIKLIQLRNKKLAQPQLIELAKSVMPLCSDSKAKLIVNSDVGLIERCNVDGIHLTSQQLLSYDSRPVSPDKILAASVHNSLQLLHAIKIDVDFVVVSPVLKTTSHPYAIPLEWTGLEELVALSNIPVFALGGMEEKFMNKIKNTGAFGLATISTFWS